MVFEDIPLEIKDGVVSRWKTMSETDKQHFINQVSLALSICGTEEGSKRMVAEVLKTLVQNGSETLADFGLYLDAVSNPEYSTLLGKIRRASLVIEGYRIKHAMPSEPTKSISY